MKRMRWLLLPIACLMAGVTDAAEWHLTPDGYGPVHIGMTVREASRALHDILVPDVQPNGTCYHVNPAHKSTELALMVEHDRISRVSLYGDPSQVATDAGIRIGDPSRRLLHVYHGRLEKAPHAYGGESDHYFTYWTSPSRHRGIRYEVVDGVVSAIHAGGSSITYIEGCD